MVGAAVLAADAAQPIALQSLCCSAGVAGEAGFYGVGHGFGRPIIALMWAPFTNRHLASHSPGARIPALNGASCRIRFITSAHNQPFSRDVKPSNSRMDMESPRATA